MDILIKGRMETGVPTRESLNFDAVSSGVILLDTLGFELHMKQIRQRRGEAIPPEWYLRPHYYQLYIPPEKIYGNGEEIIVPPYIKKPDYEFEIAMYCPRAIQTTDLADAIEYVTKEASYTIMNDMSARCVQADDMKIPLSVSLSKGIIGKSFGPKWVSAKELCFDENGVPDIKMSLRVNEEFRMQSNFRSIYFHHPDTKEKQCWSFAQFIVFLGKYNQGLSAHSLLGSGTIGNGSIAEKTDLYPWLANGDVIRMEAKMGNEGNCILENKIRII